LTSQRKDAKKKRALLRAIKLERGCEACGLKLRSGGKSLHFHHLDPSNKLFSISRNVHNFGWPKILAEVAKCAVLCKCCHLQAEMNPDV
jgi:hypothetical protein